MKQIPPAAWCYLAGSVLFFIGTLLSVWKK